MIDKHDIRMHLLCNGHTINVMTMESTRQKIFCNPNSTEATFRRLLDIFVVQEHPEHQEPGEISDNALYKPTH